MTASVESSERILQLLRQTGALREGHFVLSSGLHSDRYCQCARLFDDPRIGSIAAELMAQMVRGAGIEASLVVAPALGGILWGYDLARALGARSAFAERKAGEAFELRRGFTVTPGERVILAEDVITTGGSIMEVGQLIERLGGEIAAYCCVADRSQGAFRPGPSVFSLVQLAFETYEPDALPDWLAARPIEKPGSRGIVT
jgi:orotate phosphoribosyltransferase